MQRKHYRAKIVNVNIDGTYNVYYKDNEYEYQVRPEFIKAFDKAQGNHQTPGKKRELSQVSSEDTTAEKQKRGRGRPPKKKMSMLSRTAITAL